MCHSRILIGLLLVLAACADEPSLMSTDAKVLAALTSNEQGALGTARAATARFERFEVAQSAGYTFLFMNRCMVDQSPADRGGMGYHYVRTALLDDQLDITQPEAVLYEPQANGRLRLVALEYVIPADAWTSAEPPELFGRKLTLNAFNLWALHVWIWRENPSGLFADWNPRVGCEHDPVGRMSH